MRISLKKRRSPEKNRFGFIGCTVMLVILMLCIGAIGLAWHFMAWCWTWN